MPEGERDQQDQNQALGQGRSRGNRRGRGGGRGRGRGRGGGGASRGDRNAPSQQDAAESALNDQTQSESVPVSATASRGNQGNRGNRGRRNRRGHQQNPRGAQSNDGIQGTEPRLSAQNGPRRRFGGHLTSSNDVNETLPLSSSASTPLTLSAQAPEFSPGSYMPPPSQPPQPPQSSQRNTSSQSQTAQQDLTSEAQQRLRSRRRQRKPKMNQPKSKADNLWERIQEDISNGNYECTICTDELSRKAPVWSCDICWSVIHLDCAKDWYQASKKVNEEEEVVWRCPACNSIVSEQPITDYCWCKKEFDLRQTGNLLPPHSCGQTCAKPREHCNHPCLLQCHPGPCPPCTVLTGEEPCYCGNQISSFICKDVSPVDGWSCGAICGDTQSCAEHPCKEICHQGLCQPCAVEVEATCFCGKTQKTMLCHERTDAERIEDSYSHENEEWFTGYFDCKTVCDRAYDCGVHKCRLTCHPQDEPIPHCPFSIDTQLNCPCGKTPLEDLLDHPRQTCEDEIPSCTQACGKSLPCGHRCSYTCHTGECSPCFKFIDIGCRCGRTAAQTMCPGTMDAKPDVWCMKTCQALKSCARHRCGEHCCPADSVAQSRILTQKKLRTALPVEDEHICQEICGRPLTCGNHRCSQVCHRGPCRSCPEAIWEEVSCPCGDTVLHPGVPCGSRPYCPSDCRRPTACGHPPVSHKCHRDEEPCPPCPFLTEKPCNCGKKVIPYVPCHTQRPHCGEICGRKLKCGHTCSKTCHRPEDCEAEERDAGFCQKACGKMKSSCEHMCTAPCHGDTPCNETAPCRSRKFVFCPCGRIKNEVKCLANFVNPHPDQSLKCNDECARLERNRRLADALNINHDSHTNDHVPYSENTMKLYKEMSAWADNKERAFRFLCQDAEETTIRFQPMPNRHRQFLHLLADDFGLKSESQDFGDHRHVVLWKTKTLLPAPNKTLAQCHEIRKKQSLEAETIAAITPRVPSPPGLEAYNGFVLTTPRFGITNDEVTAALAEDFSSVPSFTFKADYRHNRDTSDEIVITAQVQFSAFLTPAPVEKILGNLKYRIERTVEKENLAKAVLLCHIDSNGNITRREKHKPAPGDWSAIASKAPRPSSATGAEEKPAGRRLLGLKKKKQPEPQNGKMWQALDGDVEC